MLRRKKARARAFALVAVGLPAFAIACQVIVPGDVPDFTCSSADPSACPSGMRCDTKQSICVALDIDGSIPETDGPNVRDSGRDGSDPIKQIGTKCTTDKDCATGHTCGISTIVTSAILQSGSPVCTKPCGSSEDCPSGYVCYATGTGANWCVSAIAASRNVPATGGAQGGAPCVGDKECRSGQCDVTNGRCVDTCLSDSQCAQPTICRVSTVTGPGSTTHRAWVCGIENDGGELSGSTCNNSLGCKNGLCFDVCTPSCCRASDCTNGGVNQGACAYATGTDKLHVCYQPSSTATAANGEPCESYTNCKSYFCDYTKKCAAACCVDTDCDPGEKCLPSPDQTPYLRCVKP
jgi:hypothetical protein